VYASGVNLVRISFDDGGGAHFAIWACTGAWTVGDTVLFAVRYSANYVQLWAWVNGAGGVRATITTPVMFTGIPNSVLWGKGGGLSQIDAVILE
jgi:hypothetical protein